MNSHSQRTSRLDKLGRFISPLPMSRLSRQLMRSNKRSLAALGSGRIIHCMQLMGVARVFEISACSLRRIAHGRWPTLTQPGCIAAHRWQLLRAHSSCNSLRRLCLFRCPLITHPVTSCGQNARACPCAVDRPIHRAVVTKCVRGSRS